jgi:hypothetical protein
MSLRQGWETLVRRCRRATWAERTGGPLLPLIAVVAALGSSLAYAITAVTQQLSTKGAQRRRALPPELLLDLIRQPLWLAGIAANAASFALQVVALRFGPLALIEPIGPARWNRTARPLALALACGAAYVVTDFSIKLIVREPAPAPLLFPRDKSRSRKPKRRSLGSSDDKTHFYCPN